MCLLPKKFFFLAFFTLTHIQVKGHSLTIWMQNLPFLQPTYLDLDNT